MLHIIIGQLVSLLAVSIKRRKSALPVRLKILVNSHISLKGYSADILAATSHSRLIDRTVLLQQTIRELPCFVVSLLQFPLSYWLPTPL